MYSPGTFLVQLGDQHLNNLHFFFHDKVTTGDACEQIFQKPDKVEMQNSNYCSVRYLFQYVKLFVSIAKPVRPKTCVKV